ncbi:MAG TPA: hypothetical protein VGJ26_09220 [Pirellulales bacterium]|jgi:hypothetical protein
MFEYAGTLRSSGIGNLEWRSDRHSRIPNAPIVFCFLPSMRDSMHSRSLMAAVCVAIVSLASPLLADPLVFQIDNSQSFMSLELQSADGDALTTAQTPGSDTTALSGTLNVDLTGSTIQFLSTLDTQFALQAVPQQPLINGDPGSSPAQFGYTVELPGVASGFIASRNYVGDATSAPLPWSGGSFDATGIQIAVPISDSSYNVVVLGTPYQGDIVGGFPAANELSGGSLTLSGGVYTLTVPLYVETEFSLLGLDIVGVFSGQVVATAAVPEPGALMLATLGGVISVAVIRHRCKTNRCAV